MPETLFLLTDTSLGVENADSWLSLRLSRLSVGVWHQLLFASEQIQVSQCIAKYPYIPDILKAFDSKWMDTKVCSKV